MTDVLPALTEYLICAAFSLGMLLIGAIVFKKTQDKSYYIFNGDVGMEKMKEEIVMIVSGVSMLFYDEQR